MSFKEQLEQILKGYHDRLLMTETAYDIKQRNTALTSIINLVEKEVIGEDTPYDMNNHGSVNAKNFLRSQQRAIIRSKADE